MGNSKLVERISKLNILILLIFYTFNLLLHLNFCVYSVYLNLVWYFPTFSEPLDIQHMGTNEKVCNTSTKPVMSSENNNNPRIS